MTEPAALTLAVSSYPASRARSTTGAAFASLPGRCFRRVASHSEAGPLADPVATLGSWWARRTAAATGSRLSRSGARPGRGQRPDHRAHGGSCRLAPRWRSTRPPWPSTSSNSRSRSPRRRPRRPAPPGSGGGAGARQPFSDRYPAQRSAPTAESDPELAGLARPV
jgi:hypothetical protein